MTLPLRLGQRVRWQFERQAKIGWNNLTDGRVARGSELLQRMWEDHKNGGSKGVRRDANETIAQTLAYCLLCKDELWKLRSKRVAEVALPVEERALWSEIEELRQKSGEVSSRDRGLFLGRNIPKRDGSKDKMREWVRSVRGSMERMAEVERRTQPDIVFVVGRAGKAEEDMLNRRIQEVRERTNT